MAKTKVGIVFGGKSSEHEVSLQSARNIIRAIDQEKFDIILLGVDKNGAWHLYDANDYLINIDDPSKITLQKSSSLIAYCPGTKHPFIPSSSADEPFAVDVIFPIIHGTYGEDGALQGFLKMADLPYVGCDLLSSAICMDKDICKRLLQIANIDVAPSITLLRHHEKINFHDLKQSLGNPPYFIKPANQGSSVGVSKVTNESEYDPALTLAFKYDRKILIEKGINGREIECAILGNASPKASVCGEIVVDSGFYSYDSKYISESSAKVIVPANLDVPIHQQLRNTALSAYQTLGCSGMARVDMFLTNDNHIYINEVNTLPGFTNISMYPKMWQASGISYTDLITQLIELAIVWQKENEITFATLADH